MAREVLTHSTANNHKNIVNVFAFENVENTDDWVLIMEFCEGGNLEHYIHERYPNGLPTEQCIQVFEDVAAGLQHLNALNIVHRDLKPGNVLLSINNSTTTFKISDFGGARVLMPQEAYSSLYGTHEYMHPQLFNAYYRLGANVNEFDGQLDLWSIGVTYYETTTGTLPFNPLNGRNDIKTMFTMINEKKSGDISARQEENGKIVWSRLLPRTCDLTGCIKRNVIALLGGLLEISKENMWTFDQFLDKVANIRQPPAKKAKQRPLRKTRLRRANKTLKLWLRQIHRKPK